MPYSLVTAIELAEYKDVLSYFSIFQALDYPLNKTW